MILSLRARQAVALGALTLIILLAWNLVVWPVIDLAVSRQSDVVVLSDQLRALRTVERRAPVLGRREQAALSTLKTLDVFWSGPSEAAITASMQDLIRNAAQQSGGIVTSSSALAQNAATTHGMLAARARVDGTLGTLQHVLAMVDAAHPRLFVGNLAVSAAAPGTKDRAPQISFEFSVLGYVAAVQHAS